MGGEDLGDIPACLGRDATLLVLKEQEDAGIDIVTDGEQARQRRWRRSAGGSRRTLIPSCGRGRVTSNGTLENRCRFFRGPRVRIHLPPAESLRTIGT
jgi:methionine synthase II (cobalamin-independent)